MPETFYIIDGHSQAYVAYHALEKLQAPDGTPTGAVYGFASMLRKLLREHHPDYLAIAFDSPGPTFRHERFPAYKAQRPPMPADLESQMAGIREVLAAWPIATFEKPGFEADDLLATLVARFASSDLKVVLVTLDKDARQLLAPGQVEIFDTKKDQFLTADKLAERDGIRPDQVVDWLTMVGDATDNVPGIPLVGPKTATKLLAEHGTLDLALAAAERVAGKVGANLAAARETAPAMRELVRLDRAVPIEASLDACRLAPPDASRLVPIYRRLGFTRLLEDLAPAPVPPDRLVVEAVETLERLEALARELAGLDEVALAVALSSPDRLGSSLAGIAFRWRPGAGVWVPLGDLEGGLPVTDALERLRPVLEAQRPAKVGHDLKPAYMALRRAGIELAGIACDTMLAAYLLNPSAESYALGGLAATHLGMAVRGLEELEGAVSGKTGELAGLLAERLSQKAVLAADLAGRLAGALRPTLAAQKLEGLLSDLELPLLSVLGRMELAGVCIETAPLGLLSGELARQTEELRARAYETAGGEFLLDSPRQLGEVLFERLKLPHGRRTKTGWSTDSGVLEELAPLHPLPALVIEYRQLVKLKNTYVEALPGLVHPRTGRIHTSFNQAAASTGRLSSSNPNLQNVPIRTPLGRRIRQAFVAGAAVDGKERVLLSADYSQVELRILAHVSGDAGLSRAFHEGRDVHRAVAAALAGVPEEEVDADQRRRAKTVNFGILYGQTPFGLARELSISQDEARAFIERYFARLPRVKAWIEECIARARTEGCVRTLHGRVRWLPDIQSRQWARRAFAERTAVNTVVQGTAADLLKLAMVKADARLAAERLPARLLLSIHDELLFEVEQGAEEEVARAAREEMTGAMELDVPLVVDVGWGKSWLEAGSKQEPAAAPRG